MYFISYINNAVIKFLVYNASHVRIAGIIVLSFSSDSMYLNRTMLHIYTYTNIFVMFLSIPTYQMSIEFVHVLESFGFTTTYAISVYHH
jgi:hypothetical protein